MNDSRGISAKTGRDYCSNETINVHLPATMVQASEPEFIAMLISFYGDYPIVLVSRCE